VEETSLVKVKCEKEKNIYSQVLTQNLSSWNFRNG